MKVKLTINPDEFSQDPILAITHINRLGINNLELKTIWDRNVIALNKSEVNKLKNTFQENNLKVSAIASPLFKWYYDRHSPHLTFNQYGELPIKSKAQQKEAI